MKLERILIIIIILLVIFNLNIYRKNEYAKKYARGTNTSNEIISVEIIDKNNQMNTLYENPAKEEYVLVDIILNDNYYKDVGIRTKGSTIYAALKSNNSNNYSFKVKLDYKNKSQEFNGMSELHINRSFWDKSGLREFLVYEMYNEMGIETQQYFLGDLKIDDIDSGLVTVVEVINDDFIQYAYGTTNYNLYKPEIPLDENWNPINIYDSSSGLNYCGDELENYDGIFNNICTVNTSYEDKIRLIEIIKKINQRPTIQEIEAYFVDFDKVIKIIAVNRVMANIDDFTHTNIKNYYLYEKDGKIDIIPFDFDISMGLDPAAEVYGEKTGGSLELIPNDIEPLKSVIIKIILENEEYLQKYEEYVELALEKMNKMNFDNIVDEIDLKVQDFVYSNQSKLVTYTEYKNEVQKIKEFVKNRVKN